MQRGGQAISHMPSHAALGPFPRHEHGHAAGGGYWTRCSGYWTVAMRGLPMRKPQRFEEMAELQRGRG
jgi:hypothetical protein